VTIEPSQTVAPTASFSAPQTSRRSTATLPPKCYTLVMKNIRKARG